MSDRRVKLTRDGAQACEYFALCDNPAELIVRHPQPLLPDTPACKRCVDKINRIAEAAGQQPLDTIPYK